MALAYRWWFGRDPAPDLLDRLMAAYMFAGGTPPWARQFARQVLAPGGLDPATAADLGLDRRAPPPRHGKLIVAATGLAAVLLLILVVQAPGDFAPGASDRPSCAGAGPGLVFLEEMAYGLAGRQPPDC